jgi:hypothetical protein
VRCCLLLLACSTVALAQVPRAEFLPLDRLPTVDRNRAESLLLSLLDSEALYTAAGGLKPLSDGFWQGRFDAQQESTAEVDAVRRSLAMLAVPGELEAGVYIFNAVHGGKKSATAYVAHRPQLDELLRRRADVFAALGQKPGADMTSLLSAVDRAPAGARWRAFGLLFGYPEYAVEFFVAAGEKEKAGGGFVVRDFLSIPTVASDRGRFVYAVPKGHQPNAVDESLSSAAAPIFAEYTRRRAHYIGAGKPGPAYLLRDWCDDGLGRCSTRYAIRPPEYPCFAGCRR